MKIRKLIINGFGPYATKQELDFEENLQDKNMFVITGNTGAGKTTIFDAINFALYGEANGCDRESKSLRSDFADPGTPTEVELWFSLREKEYYVKRTPSYIKPKQRGDGFVENKPSAEIKLSKDKTVTGVNQVTKEVENILGITTEQFKQLVMIPQGEFKRLLNAKSDEKEDIFRKIFGTEIFQSIQNNIKEQSNKLKRSIEQVERDRSNKIRSFICSEVDDGLFRLINADKHNIELIMSCFYKFIEGDRDKEKKLDAKIEETRRLIDKISSEKTLGEANNKRFDNLEKNKGELDKLNQQVEQFKNKGSVLFRGKKALTAKRYEDKYNDKNNEIKELKKEIEEIDKKIDIYTESYKKAEKNFKDEQGKENEKSQLIKDIDENQRLKDKAIAYEKNKVILETLDKKVTEIKIRIKVIGLTSFENDKKIELINNELAEIKKAKEENGTLEIKQINENNKKDKLDRLRSDINLWINENGKHKKATENFKEIDQRFKVLKGKFELLEDTFRKNQAGILASNLQEGASCPVCGSIHHPSLAKLENSEITEEAVKISKDSLEEVRDQRDKKLNDLTDINSSLKAIKDNSITPGVKELLNKEDNYQVMDISAGVNVLVTNNTAILLELKNKIQILSTMINKESEKIQIRDITQKNNEKLRSELELKNEEHVLEDGNLRAAKNTLDSIKNDFKGEMKNVGELVQIGIALSERQKALKKAYEDAESAFSKIKGNLDQEMGRHKRTNEMKENADEEFKKAVCVFKESVLELGFSGYDDYKASSLTEEKIENLDVEINEFNINLSGVKKLYEASLKEIEGLIIVDLEILKDKLVSEDIIFKSLNKEQMELFARIRNNSLILEDCEKYSKTIEIDEKKYEIVGKLSNIINGDNSKKISFERYVLAAYFEDIIMAANIRFNKMTSGRFELLRKQEIGDKRKGQGLELEVFDNYTGKARDVKTLSGGEGFKASLSMALGLADVVQAYAGGIQLDTMFIDEGFGTLDPESLDNAIECLMDLQKDSRLVGIISHVPELKERIDARLEVSSTSKGSMAEFKV
ncbi:AAA family ATPase [Clostridium sp.]|uniref:AAA family ATPase n=1 Tax=Clostridium sp. TaxID=1506 RepID=UPI001A374E7B|nr:AAA family ATPase [Clostridium sp.]MBK5240307.1 AAA family ATPase [Clostridium sp.]